MVFPVASSLHIGLFLRRLFVELEPLDSSCCGCRLIVIVVLKFAVVGVRTFIVVVVIVALLRTIMLLAW